MPKRIQRRRTKGWRKPRGCIYVGRPTIYGNPFGKRWPAKERVRLFRLYLRGRWGALEKEGVGMFAIPLLQVARKELLAALPALRGHDLCCWCRPDHACHADVLLEAANAD